MAPSKKPATRKKAAVGAVRRRRPAAKKTTRRRRRSSSVGFLKGNMGMLLGVALGGVASKMLDGPLSGIMPNDMLKNAAKAAAGAFLGMRGGMVGGIGLGIFAASASDLVEELMPDGIAGIPALISGAKVPALISDEFGNVYAPQALGMYSSPELANRQPAPNYMDMGYDVSELGAMGL
jgi:predicted lipid-binding transport protein (Tim44 family)